ncbi:MAG: Rv0909 family putative TA system antitoxin [Glaciihabitans sp.]
MAGLGDIGRKAQEFLQSEKGQDALKSEKAEGISDSILDKVSQAADKATGGKHADKIKNARDQADKHIGNQ